MGAPKALIEAIIDCDAMIDAAQLARIEHADPAAEPLPSLLEQCQELTDKLPVESSQIRTVHHFACTGGTLIAKALACMPNTQLLSEVEPFSRVQGDPSRGFYPTDLIQQLRHSSRGSDSTIEGEIYVAGLRALYKYCQRRGLRLILRDHSHSHYCAGSKVASTPVLRALAKQVGPVRSVVTVRHPLDSFLSMQDKGWLHFEPPSLTEYCVRYLQFLDDYEDVTRFKYEDFVASPEAVMEAICNALDLPFAKGFEDLFSVHHLSGDSGRSSDVIGRRERRPVSPNVQAQITECSQYASLCKRMGYESD